MEQFEKAGHSQQKRKSKSIHLGKDSCVKIRLKEKKQFFATKEMSWLCLFNYCSIDVVKTSREGIILIIRGSFSNFASFHYETEHWDNFKISMQFRAIILLENC